MLFSTTSTIVASRSIRIGTFSKRIRENKNTKKYSLLIRCSLIILPCFGCCTLFAEGLDTAKIRTSYELALKELNEANDYERARTIAQSALKQIQRDGEQLHFPMSIQFNNLLGDCALELGDYEQALLLFTGSERRLTASGEPNPELLAETLNKIGNYYRELKDLERAIDYFDRALEIRLSLYGKRHLKIADLYNNIGDCMYQVGDYDRALEYHEQVLSIRQEKLPFPHFEIAESYNNRGLCWQGKGGDEFAKNDYEKALNIYQALYGTSLQPTAVGHIHLNLGSVYDVLFLNAQEHQDPSRADEHNRMSIKHYKKALKIYQRNFASTHPAIAHCYNNLANAYAKRSAYDIEAAGLHRKALEALVFHHGPVHPDVAEIYYNMGQGYFISNNYSESLENFEACFRALHYEPGPDASFDKVNNFNILISTFKMVGTVYMRAYYTDGRQEYLKEALSCFQQADRLFDFLRQRYETIGSRLQLAQYAFQMYDEGMLPAQELYHLTGDTSYWHQCFQFSEKSKGLLLLEAVKKSDPNVFARVPEEELAAIKEMEREIANLERDRFLEEGKSGRSDNGSVDSIAAMIFDQRQVLSAKVDSMKAHYPDYYDLIYETSTLSVAQIQQQLLEPGQTMVEYFLGAYTITIFVINRDDFQVVEVPLPQNFSILTYAFSSSIQRFSYISSKKISRNIKFYRESAFELYQILFAPIRELLGERIIIIPGGELEELPFEALLSSTPDEKTVFNDYPFLVRDYTISYNYSASLLQEMMEKRPGKNLRPYLGIAPEFPDSSTIGLNPLRYNRREIENVQNLMGGNTLFQADATKENFMKRQQAYRVLHLATHGLANPSEADYSFLAFSEIPDHPVDRSLLYVKEIYNLLTNAELVVLSACQTGVGELQKGEGIASIARSFSYAGAKSLLATRWSVDDRSTSKLIELFFSKIKEGMPKDEALRAAKLDFIASENRRNSHPFYWAAFVSFGDMDPIAFHNPWQKAWLFFPLLLFGYLVAICWKIRRFDRLLVKESLVAS